MLEHAAERKTGANTLAELSLLLPDYPFPFMLNAHVNIFGFRVILLAFFFLNQEKLYTEYLKLKTRLKEHICVQLRQELEIRKEDLWLFIQY